MIDKVLLLGDLTQLLTRANTVADAFRSALAEQAKAPAEDVPLSADQAEWLLGEINSNQARLGRAQEFVRAGRVPIATGPFDPAALIVCEIKNIVNRLPAGPEPQVNPGDAPVIIDDLEQVLQRFRVLCTPHGTGGGPDDAVLLGAPRRFEGPHGSGDGPDD